MIRHSVSGTKSALATHRLEQHGVLTPAYSDPLVRARILEFLGGSSSHAATAHFITADDMEESARRPVAPSELDDCLRANKEISRSLLDHESFLAHLDIEYVNFDFPGEVYLRPLRAFALQEPVVQASKRLLRDWGIEPLHILSGRGHHFVWKMPFNSPSFAELARLGSGPPMAHRIPASRDSARAQLVIQAFTGLGMVMEFFAHRIKEESASICKIPVEFTAIEVGTSECGREMVSIDVSEYGDPVSSRSIRVPFSIYLKPWQQRASIGHDIVNSLPLLYFIPIKDQSDAEGLLSMRDPLLVRKLAAESSTEIPYQEEGMRNLIREYLGSPLHHFHEGYYSHRPHTPEEWPDTYDRVDLDALPCCARKCLAEPNDNLLRPSGVRLLTRVFLALGWHPRHIAGLIWSKFDRDFGWGDRWVKYDPLMRADFYVRLFAGLFYAWHDDLVDFNCVSFKEAHSCSVTECPFNLNAFRQSALTRRRYGQLAHRPFNRLFLPTKHL